MKWEVANPITSEGILALLESGVEISGSITLSGPDDERLAEAIERSAADAGIVLVRHAPTIEGSSTEPTTVVELAANAGLDAISTALGANGARVEKALLLLAAEGLPDGVLNACTAGSGVDDAHDLIALLTSHLVHAAARIGVRVDVVPMGVRGEG
jgi:ABC-type branched-subunit amino acid transport system substrate-binding protein